MPHQEVGTMHVLGVDDHHYERREPNLEFTVETRRSSSACALMHQLTKEFQIDAAYLRHAARMPQVGRLSRRVTAASFTVETGFLVRFV
jgi:hypothetical protein